MQKSLTTFYVKGNAPVTLKNRKVIAAYKWYLNVNLATWWYRRHVSFDYNNK